MALLIFIAALWMVVLTPGFLKRRSERQSVGSIDHFHHQLHLLERTGPKLVAPAYRLQSAEPSGLPPVGASGYPTISSMPRRPNLVLLQPVGDGETGSGADELVEDGAGGHYRRIGPPVELLEPTNPDDAPAPRLVRMADPERYRRQQIRRRRRDIVGLLAGTTVLTALLGLVPSLHILWVVTVVGVLGLAAYIGLAVQALRMARLPGAAAGTRGGTARDAHQYAGRGYPGAWDDVDIAASDPDGYGYGDYEPDRRAVAR